MIAICRKNRYNKKSALGKEAVKVAAEERKPLHLEGTVEHVMYCNAENVVVRQIEPLSKILKRF